MLWLLLACQAKGPVDSVTSPEDSARPSWPSLSRAPTYESTEDSYATGLAWVDIDRDGDADLLVASGNDMREESLYLYRNVDGQLELTASWVSQFVAFFGHLAVADLNGDGWPDLAVSRFLGPDRFDSPGRVEVYLNREGSLSDTPDWASPPVYTFSCALGDMDRDGDADLAVAVGEPYQAAPAPSLVFENDGQGDFGEGPVWTTEAPRHSLDVAWVDLDGDGWLDLSFANIATGHTAYRNLGGSLEDEPFWTAEGESTRFEGNTLDWGDVDGDGLPELAISDNSQLGGLGTTSLYCGPTLERCWESTEPRMSSAVSLEDLDGDGAPELILGSWWGPVEIFANVGGFSTTPTQDSGTRTVVEAFAWEDLDGSDREVVVVEGEGLVPIPWRGRVLSVSGGVATDGYLSGPGTVRAEVLAPAPRDLAVTNWDPNVGNHLYTR